MTQVASETINALKTSPLLLVVVVLNAGMIFALLYIANVQRDERQTLTKYVVEIAEEERHNAQGLLFWVIWIICLVVWLGANFGGLGGSYGHLAGGGVIEFVMFGLLGWAVFGPPIQ